MTNTPKEGQELRNLVVTLVECLAAAYPSDIKTALLECTDRSKDFSLPMDQRPIYRRMTSLLRGASK